MARRNKTSLGEDFVGVVALFPWWVGVALAVAFYIILHLVGMQQVSTDAKPEQVGTMLTQTFVKAFANVGQYLLPALCLLGVGISVWKRQKRQNLLTNAAQSDAADVLDGISWHEFELLVGEAFRMRGYAVTETGGGGADGGIDLILTKGSEKFLVQCKQWRAFKVGVQIVRELYGVMAATGAAGGFVVTSGRFTEEAEEFATGRNIQLVDGAKLQFSFWQFNRKFGHPNFCSELSTGDSCHRVASHVRIRTSVASPRVPTRAATFIS